MVDGSEQLAITRDGGQLAESRAGLRSEPAAKRRQAERTRPLTLIEPDFAVGLDGCVPRLHRANHSPLRSCSTVVSSRVRLARSDVDRVLDTGAGCRRASDQVGCVLRVVR
jgi:hypothetical protein